MTIMTTPVTVRRRTADLLMPASSLFLTMVAERLDLPLWRFAKAAQGVRRLPKASAAAH
jgi:hypothetical protein